MFRISKNSKSVLCFFLIESATCLPLAVKLIPWYFSYSMYFFSSNKKMGILGDVAAAISIIVIVGFIGINQGDMAGSVVSSTPNNPLLVTVDQTQYQRADIISISGDSTSDRQSIVLSIENTSGIKIWKENIEPKNGGNFSTLVIAGGGGWENGGSYTLKAVQNDLVKEIKFRFVA